MMEIVFVCVHFEVWGMKLIDVKGEIEVVSNIKVSKDGFGGWEVNRATKGRNIRVNKEMQKTEEGKMEVKGRKEVDVEEEEEYDDE